MHGGPRHRDQALSRSRCRNASLTHPYSAEAEGHRSSSNYGATLRCNNVVVLSACLHPFQKCQGQSFKSSTRATSWVTSTNLAHSATLPADNPGNVAQRSRILLIERDSTTRSSQSLQGLEPARNASVVTPMRNGVGLSDRRAHGNSE